MDSAKKPSAKFTDDVFLKSCSVLSFISMLLIFALFLRMETITRRTKMNEMRISDVESRMKIFSSKKVDEMETFMDSRSNLKTVPVHFKRKRRNAESTTTPAISLQQIHQEINNKLSQVCTAPEKLCQTGPPGPQGAHGYPGYKGEKGAPGKTGPRGPMGPIGAPGESGKRGPMGTQGVKGEKGDRGYVGAPGIEGGEGPMGRPGDKGTIGLKGNRGMKGSMGIRGPKGHVVISPKIRVFPESQKVLINKSATFYCWVDGHTSTRTTWRKLGNALADDTSVSKGEVLHIRNAKRSHDGSYLCSVFTVYGVLRAISTLKIEAPPIFTKKPPPQVHIDAGSSLTLCCEAEGSISWTRAQKPLNLISAIQQNGCLTISSVTYESAGKYVCRATNSFGFAESITAVIVAEESSCYEAWNKRNGSILEGENLLAVKNQFLKVYCDMSTDHRGWTLIARFSNSDNKNWMRDGGFWWYDQQSAVGRTTDPSTNSNMISSAFWMIRGRYLKITRSDDPSHTPLLQTTGNCLAGQTFRSKITIYGDFRNGKVWASDQCLRSCTVHYGGQYKSTDGFQQAECSGNIQSANKIGFWCDWSDGDGSVLMIGGGGGSCARADHGIGITETNSASFNCSPEFRSN